MIRLTAVRPRQRRNLRHWAMELVVVVVGVLIALAAAEWAENRREAASDRRILSDVRTEMKFNLQAISYWAAQDRCLISDLRDYRTRLEASNGEWTGIEAEEREDRIYPVSIAISTAPVVTSQFDRAVRSGAIERLEAGRDIRTAYAAFDIFKNDLDAATGAIADLQLLVAPNRFSAEERNDYLGVIANLDRLASRMRQITPQAYGYARSATLDFDENWLDGFAELTADERAERPDCFEAIDLRTGEPVA